MFPAVKKVGFKVPLEEEVKTRRYTLRHSDIESSASTISTLELTPADGKDEIQHEKGVDNSPKKPDENHYVFSPHTGDKRESDDEDSDTCPATPVAGRRKRHRQWRWTLGPVESRSSKDEPAEDVGSKEQEPKPS